MKKKVLIEGPILTSSGYGEHARLVYRSLRNNENLEIYLSPLNWGQCSWSLEDDEETKEITQLITKTGLAIQNLQPEHWKEVFDIHIHIGIPNEFDRKGKYCLCVTAGIETNQVSSNWIIKTNGQIDKMIVPSEHAKAGFINSSYSAMNTETEEQVQLTAGCPISVVPYPVKSLEATSPIINLEDDFNFLSVALWGERKNMESMVKWFIEEFRQDSVGLVIKTGLAKTSIPDRILTEEKIRALCDSLGPRNCKIYLLHGSLTNQEMHSLYVHPKIKAYLTTTHGEGFGLPIFEAAYSGLPIVATDWSGHLDFLSGTVKENNKMKIKKLFAKVDFDLKPVPERAWWPHIIVKNSMWAYPKESSFKRQIRNVYKNHGMYKKWSNSLKQQIEDSHSAEEIYKLMSKEILEGTEVDLNFDNSGGDEVIVL